MKLILFLSTAHQSHLRFTMKVLVFVAVACLLSGANGAGFLDTLKGLGTSIGDLFKNLFNDLKTPLANVTNALVESLKTAGTQLLATGAQSLLGSLANVGKREVSVAGGISKFLQEGKQVIGQLSETLGSLYHSAMTALTGIAQRITSMDFLKDDLSTILTDIADVVGLHNIFQDSLVETLTKNPGQFLINAAKGLISKLGRKRSALADTLASIGQKFASLFLPVIQAVKEHVANLGSTLSAAASALYGSIKPTLDQLSTSLGEHIQALKDSASELVKDGQAALKALAAAAGDMAGQTSLQQTLETLLGSQ
ncbi:uncharacterized protein LOC124257467 isoform X2 [Haliotis rubra]|uniref:uncharacterized protein LOC124257467 isoform X2 n=1 Tax=Haliotis rubra TaxID=36100 RepID=UPI001EE56793|nr:uncharacterized protein LOC124257467 isoform X2 [Haliotis rubra]